MRFLLLLIIAIPSIVFAQAGDPSLIDAGITSVGGTLDPITGGGGAASGGGAFVTLVQNFILVLEGFVPLVSIIAVIMIIVGGLMMVIIDDEGNAARLKNIVIGCVSGLIIINMAYIIANAFINYQSGGVGTIIAEVDGLINWASFLVGMLIIASIIVTGIRAVASFGSEDGAGTMRQAIVSLVIGLVFITARYVLAESFVNINPGPIVNIIGRVTSSILVLFFIIGVTILIYYGIRLVIGLGNDEDITNARSMIVRMVIGLVIIGLSYWIATTLAGVV